MKKFILFLIVLLSITVSAFAVNFASEKPVTDSEWNTLLSAMAEVESNGNVNAKTLDTNGKYSYGCLQIQDLYLIDSRLDYTLNDLFNKEISFEVAKAYLKRYAKSYEARTGKVATYEVLARIHNGGPRGAEHSATNSYWTKVKAILEK